MFSFSTSFPVFLLIRLYPMGSMVRLSSQSKSNPGSLVAECKATGMCTNPKLIAPFQITRLVDVSIVDSTALTGCGKRVEWQTCTRNMLGCLFDGATHLAQLRP